MSLAAPPDSDGPPSPHSPDASLTATAEPLVVAPRIAWWTLIHYSTPLVPAQFLYMMVTVVYMNFATDVLLLAPGVIGTIFFASKIWDAVSDPMIGFLSDRTRSRFGRRKSWMYASAIPLGAMSVMLWSPPPGLGESAQLWWVIVSVLGFYTAYTIYAIPQMALGVEFSPDPHERARVFAGRQISLTFGMLGAFAFATPMIIDNPAARENANELSIVLAAALVLALLVCTFCLPSERPDHAERGAQNPVRAVRDVVRNPHARLLLFVYFIEIFGIGATSAMTPYLLKYVINAADAVGTVFLFYTIPAVASIPFWVAMGRRYERHKLWRFAMGLQAIGYGTIFFQEEGRLALMIASSVINGFATACGQTLGYSIKGDVIDYDDLATGERKEGSYLAAWSLAAKLGTGLMIALSGWALQGSGFTPNAEQSEFVVWTIKAMTGGAPFVCILIGMAAFSRFSLDGQEANRIRAEIVARNTATTPD